MMKKYGRFMTLGCFLLLLGLNLYGCILFDGATDKKLLSYYDEEPLTAARFYTRAEDGSMNLEELPTKKLSDLTKTLDSMELTYHSFHTDYFWGGQFGIELERRDGTFLTYDGTLLSLRSCSVKEGYSTDDTIRSSFLEVTNCEFWEEMEGFFPSVKEAHPRS